MRGKHRGVSKRITQERESHCFSSSSLPHSFTADEQLGKLIVELAHAFSTQEALLDFKIGVRGMKSSKWSYLNDAMPGQTAVNTRNNDNKWQT